MIIRTITKIIKTGKQKPERELLFNSSLISGSSTGVSKCKTVCDHKSIIAIKVIIIGEFVKFEQSKVADILLSGMLEQNQNQ